MVLSWGSGVGVFNYYYNIMIIYKQKDRTHFDDILFDKSQHYINVCLVGNGCGSISCTDKLGSRVADATMTS